ncbi:MAG: right-handed parallel beta-helix repeat-containing protein [Chitinivibrionales bacterium]|nr:right-handed parallel beta-helix repeat-containing protein [Chitinivibrionales bacterium]
MWKDVPIVIIAFGVVAGLPARTIVVNNGAGGASDANAGTEAAPLKTIQAAAMAAQPGDIVLIHGGTYRERVTPPRGGNGESSRIVYSAAPHESVYVKGSDIWQPAWQKVSDKHYSGVPADAMFNDDVYIEDKNPFKVRLYATNGKNQDCGMVFVDGVMAEHTYNGATGAITVTFPDNNPSAHTVEITTRRRIFSPHIRGLGYVTVQGIAFYHAGNQSSFWIDANFGNFLFRETMGAVDVEGGNHWTFENCDIEYSVGCGIDIAGYSDAGSWERNPVGGYNEGYSVVRNCVVSHHGQLGISTSFKAGTVGYNQVVGNYCEGNSWALVGCAEEAAIKSHNLANSIIADNIIVDQYAGGGGIWMDWKSSNNNRITRNFFAPNASAAGMPALFYEVSPGSANLCDNNVFLGPIRYSGTDGNTNVNNLVTGSIDGGTNKNNIVGVACAFNQLTGALTFTPPVSAFAAGKTIGDARANLDYFSNPYSATVLDGPFQKMTQGPNTFYITFPKHQTTVAVVRFGGQGNFSPPRRMAMNADRARGVPNGTTVIMLDSRGRTIGRDARSGDRYARGVYFVQCRFGATTETRELVIQK